jgi:hypothetical protein
LGQKPETKHSWLSFSHAAWDGGMGQWWEVVGVGAWHGGARGAARSPMWSRGWGLGQKLETEHL